MPIGLDEKDIEMLKQQAEIERLTDRAHNAEQNLLGAHKEVERLRAALEQAVSDFGDSHCVCEDTKQMCIDALKSVNEQLGSDK